MRTSLKTYIYFLIGIFNAFTCFAQLPTEPLLFTDIELQKLTFDDIPGRKIDSINSDLLWEKWLENREIELKRGIYITGDRKLNKVTSKSIINEKGVRPRHRSLYENPVDLLNEAKISYVGSRKVYHFAIESKGADCINFESIDLELSESGKLFFISKDKKIVYNEWKRSSVKLKKREFNHDGIIWFNTVYELNKPTDSVIIEYSEDIEEVDTKIIFYEIYHVVIRGEIEKHEAWERSNKKYNIIKKTLTPVKY
jgi:hypothetical protein